MLHCEQFIATMLLKDCDVHRKLQPIGFLHYYELMWAQEPILWERRVLAWVQLHYMACTFLMPALVFRTPDSRIASCWHHYSTSVYCLYLKLCGCRQFLTCLSLWNLLKQDVWCVFAAASLSITHSLLFYTVYLPSIVGEGIKLKRLLSPDTVLSSYNWEHNFQPHTMSTLSNIQL